MSKIYNEKDFIKILMANGYRPERTKGSHTVYAKTGFNNIIINKRLNPMVAKRLIKENKLKEEGK